MDGNRSVSVETGRGDMGVSSQNSILAIDGETVHAETMATW